MSKKILLTEDEEFIAEMYKLALEKNGMEVQVAHNGKEALDHLCTFTPDLMLLDALMPEMNGFETLTAVRNDGKTFPIIMLSNLSQEMDMDKCKKLGAQDFLVKSDMNINQLWEKVQKYLV